MTKEAHSFSHLAAGFMMWLVADAVDGKTLCPKCSTVMPLGTLRRRQ